MIFLFWLLAFLIFYGYFGYPLLLAIVAKFKNRPVQKANITPSVSILISLYNEEDVIAAKLQNLSSLEYPRERIQILLGSDGSTDQTNSMIQNHLKDHPDFPVQLLEFSQRRGKMSTLNELITHAQGEIIFF
ncbi:MAG: glycosyltransferase, partial [Candidatus Omnitrophica bacterium]|nr:glycosyltransferase [Candidatus Omnitrophota bacterium]